jgi:exodeoxyribonuclease-5
MGQAADMTTTTHNLSDDQLAAFDAATAYCMNAPPGGEFKLAGLAGTGKTTLVRVIADYLAERGITAQVLAYTGKAVHVLHKKGLTDARTIHSFLYRPIVDARHRIVGWEMKPPDDIDIACADVLIVDEASMISRAIYDDLMGLEKSVLWVGDHGQLEPVGDDIYLMANPDVRLENIHRQAANSRILVLAHDFRNGAPAYHADEDDDLYMAPMNHDVMRSGQLLTSADQIIVGTNNTRNLLNARVRAYLGYAGAPQPGERVICLKNDAKRGLFNGMTLTIADIISCHNGAIAANLAADDGTVYRDVSMASGQFFFPKGLNEANPRSALPFDYAYAITCHKAQGSEWDRVVVVEDSHLPFNMPRWRYTAATRAAAHLTYLFNG